MQMYQCSKAEVSGSSPMNVFI